jgi:hypothetical protein
MDQQIAVEANFGSGYYASDLLADDDNKDTTRCQELRVCALREMVTSSMF